MNTLFWPSRSFKVIEFGANREPKKPFILRVHGHSGSSMLTFPKSSSPVIMISSTSVPSCNHFHARPTLEVRKSKCRYGSFAFLPFSCLKLAQLWLLIDANISDQLPKSHKTACKSYRYIFSQKKVPVSFPGSHESAGTPYRSIPSHFELCARRPNIGKKTSFKRGAPLSRGKTSHPTAAAWDLVTKY